MEVSPAKIEERVTSQLQAYYGALYIYTCTSARRIVKDAFCQDTLCIFENTLIITAVARSRKNAAG